MVICRSVLALSVLALLQPLQVLSQSDNYLGGALNDYVKPSAAPVTRRPIVQAKGTRQAAEDLDLADALDKNQKPRGEFSDHDLDAVSRDNTYKPDKGKGGLQRSDTSQSTNDESSEINAEVGTIAGIISAVGMALVGAISSYISYQKKKLCFSIQQSLNADIGTTEIPEGVVATEPYAQQTLLEQPKSGPASDKNTV